MAIYRAVQTAFWEDAKIQEEFTPEDRYGYLYLLTNPSVNQIGIYQITKKKIAFEMGWTVESVNALMERFEKHHNLIRYNKETREICILNWGKYNLKSSNKPLMDCVKSELKSVKDTSLLLYVAGHIPNEKIKDLFMERYELSTGGTNCVQKQKEKEKEKEKEKQQHIEKEELKKDDTKKDVVVVENEIDRSLAIVEIKKAFNQLIDSDIKKVADSLKSTTGTYDIEYLTEKIKITKNTPHINNITGFLIKAIRENYDIKSLSNTNTQHTTKPTKFHNFEETFTKYSNDEFEDIIEKSQRAKFDK